MSSSDKNFDYHEVYTTPETWKSQLDALPSLEELNGKIPTIFLAHGQPLLVGDKVLHAERAKMMGEVQSPGGILATFLQDLGPTLIQKYKPKAVVVFSAHFESHPIYVTDYQTNPLLMDYYNFQPYFYKLQFDSKGDHKLSEQIVKLLKEHNIKADLINENVPRGRDGRGFDGPGLDHGVFVPFKLMFGDSPDIPIVQVSIDSSLDVQKEWNLGNAIQSLRSQGILIIAGGLTLHSFEDLDCFSRERAGSIYKEFEKSIIDAADVEDPEKRKQALFNLTKHPGFRPSHPREEHFVPLYVAAGAAPEGKALILSGSHGSKTVAFGV